MEERGVKDLRVTGDQKRTRVLGDKGKNDSHEVLSKAEVQW